MVNRHTGGLENIGITHDIFKNVNRHTGGLEKYHDWANSG